MLVIGLKRILKGIFAMNKKTISLVAMIVSVLVAFFGFLTLVGAMGGDTDIASASFDSGSFLYDNGYAEFGADFYTYVSNNAAAAADAAESAASAARTVASNLNDIATLLKSFCGIFLMGFGLVNLCRFAMIWKEEKEIEEILSAEAAAGEVIAEEEASVEAAPAEEAEI